MVRLRRKARNDADLHETHSVLSWEHDLVRAAVVHLGDGVAELMGVASSPVQWVGRTTQPDVDRWFAACSAALTEAEDATTVGGGRRIVANYITMGIPAELASGLPITVQRPRRDRQEPVTLHELQQLLRKSYRSAQDSLVAKGGAALSSMDIVSGAVSEISLDGQVIDDPVGLLGDELALTVHYCLAPHVWVRTLQLVAERLKTGLTAIVPHQVTLARPLPHPSALLVELGERHTIVSGVRRGRIAWSDIVEVGERQLVEATAATLSLRERQASALMRTYRARQLSAETEEQVAAAFWVQLRDWMKQIGAAALPYAREAAPRQVFFVDETRRMPEAVQALQTPYWEQQLPFGCCPDVVEYAPNIVRHVLDCTGRAGGSEFLRLRSIAYGVCQDNTEQITLERLLAQMTFWR